MDSGSVIMMKIYVTEHEWKKFEIKSDPKVHTKRVMGLHYLEEMNYLFSTSEDGKFKVTDVKTSETVWENMIHKSGLK